MGSALYDDTCGRGRRVRAAGSDYVDTVTIAAGAAAYSTRREQQGGA